MLPSECIIITTAIKSDMAKTEAKSIASLTSGVGIFIILVVNIEISTLLSVKDYDFDFHCDALAITFFLEIRV
jgi:hypothetical protein